MIAQFSYQQNRKYLSFLEKNLQINISIILAFAA